jgi:hypothetical protein
MDVRAGCRRCHRHHPRHYHSHGRSKYIAMDVKNDGDYHGHGDGERERERENGKKLIKSRKIA